MKKKITGSLAILAAVTLMSVAEIAPQEDSITCSCAPHIEFDHSLPMSHPVNRCASEQQTGVSWASWVTGSSTSYQFHYLDLLELLSRAHDQPQDKN